MFSEIVNFRRLGTPGASPILMVAKRTVLTTLKEMAASRIATAIHWETGLAAVRQDANDVVNLEEEANNLDEEANTRIVLRPKLGQLELPMTLMSEIKQFL